MTIKKKIKKKFKEGKRKEKCRLNINTTSFPVKSEEKGF